MIQNKQTHFPSKSLLKNFLLVAIMPSLILLLLTNLLLQLKHNLGNGNNQVIISALRLINIITRRHKDATAV